MLAPTIFVSSLKQDDSKVETENIFMIICTECPKKNFLLGKIVIEASNMGQISCPRTVLKNSGSEDFKTVLT